jgi:hypothetical protein
LICDAKITFLWDISKHDFTVWAEAHEINLPPYPSLKAGVIENQKATGL